MCELETERILGYSVVGSGNEACLDAILGWVKAGRKAYYLVCANPHSIQVARSDALFHEAILNADIITPDGVGVVLASKILGGSIEGRLTGSDIFWGLSKKLNEKGTGSYFFLGSTEPVLKAIRARMAKEFSGVAIAGTYSPPFKEEFTEEDNRLMIEAINCAQPDVLWVGMTAPKQEKWIYRNRDKLDVGFIGAIGAVFDFFSGRIKRSHPVFQKMGLEWLPRLMQEPIRLWKRNFVSNPAFLLRVLGERIRR